MTALNNERLPRECALLFWRSCQTAERPHQSERPYFLFAKSVSLPLLLWLLFLFSPAMKDELLPAFSSAGFVDLQTEKADLLETAGAIPFLDYKHFAAKIFFPEVQSKLARQHRFKSVKHALGDVTAVPFSWQSNSLMASCVKDIGQVRLWLQLSQDVGTMRGHNCHCCVWPESGCGAGSARRRLPGHVQADPRPVLPYLHGARSGRAEELQHQRKVSLMFGFDRLSFIHLSAPSVVP